MFFLNALMAGFIGMALSYGLSLNSCLVSSVQSQCMLANMIVSAERLEQYMHIASEAPEIVEGNRPASGWPDGGKVEICDLEVNCLSFLAAVAISRQPDNFSPQQFIG